MSDWYSEENLQQAWKYTKNEIRDDFAFDIINHEDIKYNIDRVLASLKSQLETGQYHPVPILQIAVPKNNHSVRPGTTISVIDMIVLYAIVQQIAPMLDEKLADSAYAYRLDSQRRRQLFSAREAPHEEPTDNGDEESVEGTGLESEDEIAFPYNWFRNWLAFHRASLAASEGFDFVAVTDITAYFENISVDLLFDRMRELLSNDHRELVNRLYEMLRYWDWSSSNYKVKGKGLPQGNDISSFLSNIYLIDLDSVMLSAVNLDPTKYHRYVDDVKIYTSSYREAQHALLDLEKTLRKLGLNVQSAKTNIVPASTVFDPDVTEWEQRLSDDAEGKVADAKEFFESIFDVSDPNCMKKWERIYRRSLTVLGQANDAAALPAALAVFLRNPSSKILLKNFIYLKRFITEYQFEADIYDRLISDDYLFDYHRAYLCRLAAYSRGDHSDLRINALDHSINGTNNWFSRVAALLLLSTYDLTGNELAQIASIINSESNAQVIRAAFVTLAQHSGEELRIVLDWISFFNAPHQDYLRRYFFRLVRDKDLGVNTCNSIGGASLSAPEFFTRLHQLDLVKANSNSRREFRTTIEQKIADCQDSWPRLRARLEGIQSAFIENP